MVTTMSAVSLTQEQYQQFIDRVSGLEARMATLRTHAEAQQEQIRVAEMVIQLLRAAGTNPTNPPPPFRAACQIQVTEGGAFKALTKYTGNHSEYHDWSFSARRVLTREDERFAGQLQLYRDRSMGSTRTMCLSTEERQLFIFCKFFSFFRCTCSDHCGPLQDFL